MLAAPPLEQPRPIHRALFAGFLLLCLSLGWYGLGGHPFYARSDARYAVVSMNMAASETLEGWLVPTFDGHPHLTKPPLTYWLEAACLRLMGHRELPVRIPSALAGTLTLLTLLALVWHTHGQRQALLAAAMLSIMPMFAWMNRLPLTDSLLNVFWFGTLAAGLMTVRHPGRARWPGLMWLCVALGLLTKGPLAWVPVGLLLLWLGLGRRWIEVRALRLPVGLPLSLVPLGGWVVAMVLLQPAALAVWWHEMADRVAGRQAPHLHPHSILYFVPIFLGGLFPATIIMMLPWLNYSWGAAWAAVRRGDEVCLWAMGVVVPFVMFSVIPGKLPSYLLPLCAPMAVITGGVLMRCLNDQRGVFRRRPPEPALESGETADVKLPRPADAFCIAAVATATVGMVLMLAPMRWLFAPIQKAAQFDQSAGVTAGAAGSVPPSAAEFLRHAGFWVLPAAMFLGLAGIALRVIWQFDPARRFGALMTLWVGVVLLYLAAFQGENRLAAPNNDAALLAAIHQKIGLERPKLITVGISDLSLTFYNQRPAPRCDHPIQIKRWLDSNPNELVLLAEAPTWEKLRDKEPAFADQFETVMTWDAWWRDQPRLVLRPRGGAQTAPATQHGDESGDEMDDE